MENKDVPAVIMGMTEDDRRLALELLNDLQRDELQKIREARETELSEQQEREARAAVTPRGYRYPTAFDPPDIALYFSNLANDVSNDVGVQDGRISKRLEFLSKTNQSTHAAPISVTTTKTTIASSAGPAFTVTPGKSGLVHFSIRCLVKSPSASNGLINIWVEKRKDAGAWTNLYDPVPGNSQMNQTVGNWIQFSHTTIQLLGAGLLDFRLVAQVTSGSAWTADNSFIRAVLIGETA